MKLLGTEYLNRLAKPLQKLMLVLLMIMPLLTLSPATQATEQNLEFSQAELDQMLAPIALYPDALLSQVLIASTYPLEVIQADRWVRSNNDLKAEDALKFAENKSWDPSVKALVAFPDILKRMSEDVDWTQRLGDAFLSNEGDVMDAVQRLRKRAYATGNLEKAQHISVERDDNHIIIEPAQERIVYVPVYDTRVVYGNWWWPEYPPVYWHYPSNYTYISGFYWGSSIHLGHSYFYSSCHWRDRRIVVIDRNHYLNSDTRFYTGRSIVHHDSARHWSHNPAHRGGVAYYNNRLRENYRSTRPSYEHDRQYREQYNDARTSNRNQEVNRHDNTQLDPRLQNHTNNNPRPFDRSEQVRERLNRTQNNSGNTHESNTEIITDTNTREHRPWRNNNDNREVIRPNQRAAGPNFSVPPQTQTQAENSNISPNFNLPRDETTDLRRAAMQTREQHSVNTEPQQRIERIQNPRFNSPRDESNGMQRAERANQNPRFSREKKDDENK